VLQWIFSLDLIYFSRLILSC
jgi:hypothetical protein